MSDNKEIFSKFAELVRAYGAPSATCEVEGHQEVNTLSATMHDNTEGASWLVRFDCSGCGTGTTLYVCERYYNTLENWLKPRTGMDIDAMFGECSACSEVWTFRKTYKGGIKWG